MFKSKKETQKNWYHPQWILLQLRTNHVVKEKEHYLDFFSMRKKINTGGNFLQRKHKRRFEIEKSRRIIFLNKQKLRSSNKVLLSITFILGKELGTWAIAIN